jgi:hypothetical protein
MVASMEIEEVSRTGKAMFLNGIFSSPVGRERAQKLPYFEDHVYTILYNPLPNRVKRNSCALH